MRVSSSLDHSVRDTSDGFFSIGIVGHNYYVNDDSLAGDFYSTAVGDNANSGTTPADPMKSVNAVLRRMLLAPVTQFS